MLSVFDLFRIGIGPSSSHTIGPMRIGRLFAQDLVARGALEATVRIRVELHGALALTGAGHGSDKAVILGLCGCDPEHLDPDDADARHEAVLASGRLSLADRRSIAFDTGRDIVFAGHIMPKHHPNRMIVQAYDDKESVLLQAAYYSIGGGSIVSEQDIDAPPKDADTSADIPHPFGSAEELLAICAARDARICDIVRANEEAMRPAAPNASKLDGIADAMMACIARGLKREGILPGGLEVQRRAPELWRRLASSAPSNEREELFDWLNVYAMAVNEENAAGGRVVTAPTNGAAGILPALMKQYCTSGERSMQRRFLLTAGGIGILYKQKVSLSGAAMGCQGEVGVACSMAAGALAELWGATPEQAAAAAEIGMEHSLGLTCDPVGGLVQIPCIERNAIGAVKAVNAARLALHRTDKMKVSLDEVIETMRQTGNDMSSRYKETSQGGLAVNVAVC